MGFRPYLLLDYRTDPAVHCLFNDNPAELNELIKRGLELAMIEKGLKYMNPAFQRQYAAKASGLEQSFGEPTNSPRLLPVTELVVDTQTVHYPSPPPEPIVDLPIYQSPLDPPPIQETSLIQQPTTAKKPRVPTGVSSFLSKVISDAQ